VALVPAIELVEVSEGVSDGAGKVGRIIQRNEYMG
jgi:hypothetical protein